MKPFRLLDLPPELWARIVKLAVTSNDFIKMEGTWVNRFEVQTAVKQPAITRTCKALRAEALPAFYKHNTVVIYGSDRGSTAFRDWLQAIGASNRAHLGEFWITGTRAATLSGKSVPEVFGRVEIQKDRRPSICRCTGEMKPPGLGLRQVDWAKQCKCGLRRFTYRCPVPIEMPVAVAAE